MSEQFHSEKPHEQTSPKEKTLPPAIQEIKGMMSPDVLSMLVLAYEGMSDEKKATLLRDLNENKGKMEQFAENPRSIKALVEDIVKGVDSQVVDKKEEKAEKKIEAKVETKQEAKVVTHEKETQKEQDDALKQARLEKAREQLTATYALFGGKDGFESKFPKHTEWKQEATARVQREAKKTGKELSPDELATRVETSMIVSHGAEIKASLASDPAKQKEFASHMGELRASADSLDIPYNTSPADIPVSKATEKAMVAELVGFKEGDKVEKTGSEIRYGDQVVDISTRPPTRSMKTDTMQVAFPDKDGTKERHYQEQQEHRNKEVSLMEERTELESYINTHREGMLEKFQQLPKMKQDYQSALEGSREKEDLKGTIEKVEKELADFKRKTERLESVKKRLDELAQEEKARNEKYQESLRGETEVVRENLQFIASTHLDILLGQEGIADLLRFINERSPGIHLSLDSKW